MFEQINAAFVSIRDFFKKKQKKQQQCSKPKLLEGNANIQSDFSNILGSGSILKELSPFGGPLDQKCLKTPFINNVT